MANVTTINAANDYLNWDNREDVTYYSHATAGDTAYALAAPDNRGGVRRRPIKTNEVIASGGVYTKADVCWRIPHVVLPANLAAAGLKPSDRVVGADGVAWTVISDVNRIVWGTIWTFTARALAIVNGLKDTIDVQRPAVTFDGSGVAVRAWPPAGGSSTPYAALACRVQPLEASVIEERALRGFRVTHAVYLSQQVTLQPDDRIKVVTGDAVPAGTLLQVRGYHNPNRIDELPVIDAEVVP